MLKKNHFDIRLLLASQEQSNEAVLISNKIPVDIMENNYKKYVEQLKRNKKKVIEIVKDKKDSTTLLQLDLTRKLKRVINQLLPKIREKYKISFTSKSLVLDFNLSKDNVGNVLNVLTHFNIIAKDKSSKKIVYKFVEGSEFKHIN